MCNPSLSEEASTVPWRLFIAAVDDSISVKSAKATGIPLRRRILRTWKPGSLDKTSFSSSSVHVRPKFAIKSVEQGGISLEDLSRPSFEGDPFCCLCAGWSLLSAGNSFLSLEFSFSVPDGSSDPPSPKRSVPTKMCRWDLCYVVVIVPSEILDCIVLLNEWESWHPIIWWYSNPYSILLVMNFSNNKNDLRGLNKAITNLIL